MLFPNICQGSSGSLNHGSYYYTDHLSPLLWLQTGENLSGNKRWRNPWSRRKKCCFKLVNWLSHGRGNLGLGNSPLQRHIYLCKQWWNSQDLGPVRQSEYREHKSMWLKMNILSKHPFFQLCLWAALEWEQGFASVLSRFWSCLAPALSLLWAQRWILGVGEVLGCPTASTSRGMQGFTSTPAHGMPLVGHCLFSSKSAGCGIKEAFYFHVASLSDTDCAVTHTAPTRHCAFLADTAPSSSEPSFGNQHVASGIFLSQTD